jgi:hypothetical protein
MQDRFFSNVAYRLQLSPRLRMGLEVQVAAPSYRFIDARPITEGYATMMSLPLSWQLYQNERIDLHFFFRPGLRWQGIIDPDGNDQRDELLNSTALLLDPGLLVNIQANTRLYFQSGVTFPTLFQLRPSALFENNSTAIHFNAAHQISPGSVLFAKTLIGPAFGANGDTQKFVWSLQAGVRFAMGAGRDNWLKLEPSY